MSFSRFFSLNWSWTGRKHPGTGNSCLTEITRTRTEVIRVTRTPGLFHDRLGTLCGINSLSDGSPSCFPPPFLGSFSIPNIFESCFYVGSVD